MGTVSITKNRTNQFPEQLFTPEQCDTLFAAVLADGERDLSAELPEIVHMNYTQVQLEECYQLSFQLCGDEVSRIRCAHLLKNIHHNPAQCQLEVRELKHVRARFKVLRHGFAIFDTRHRYPLAFHAYIALMGYLQDAIKNDSAATIRFAAVLMRCLLLQAPYTLVDRALAHRECATPDAFRDYMGSLIRIIGQGLLKGAVTGHEFHKIRIVIGRLTIFYAILRTLYPSTYHHSIFVYLSTINGLMGSMHDKLVAHKFNKTQDYYKDTFVIPEPIRRRLVAVTEKFELRPTYSVAMGTRGL